MPIARTAKEIKLRRCFCPPLPGMLFRYLTVPNLFVYLISRSRTTTDIRSVGRSEGGREHPVVDLMYEKPSAIPSGHRMRE